MNKTRRKNTWKIIDAVSRAFEVSTLDIRRRTRKIEVVDARDAVILIMKQRWTISNDEISKVFGLSVSAVTYSLSRSLTRTQIDTPYSRKWSESVRSAKRIFKLI